MVACILLAFTRTYATLLIFRAIQSISIVATITIGGLVIHDIYSASEANQLETLFQIFQYCALLLAPILGGLLAECVGWRLIFVFLLCLSAILFIAIALFLPETQRDIAGDGPMTLSGIHQPLAYRLKILKTPTGSVVRSTFSHEPARLSAGLILEPLQLFKEKDIMTSVAFGAISFTMWIMVTVSTSGLFEDKFDLNDIQLGLSFVPNGMYAMRTSLAKLSLM